MLGVFDSIFLEDDLASTTIKYNPAKSSDQNIIKRAQSQLNKSHEQDARREQKRRNLGVRSNEDDTPVVTESKKTISPKAKKEVKELGKKLKLYYSNDKKSKNKPKNGLLIDWETHFNKLLSNNKTRFMGYTEMTNDEIHRLLQGRKYKLKSAVGQVVSILLDESPSAAKYSKIIDGNTIIVAFERKEDIRRSFREFANVNIFIK